MRVRVYGPNFARSHEVTFHVHKDGCADTKKGRYKNYDRGGEGSWTLECDDIRVLVLDVYPPGEFDYPEAEWTDYADDFKIYPCCKELNYG